MGGQNSQDSTLERRSLIWNDNDIEDGEAPPAFYSGQTYKGKFYPRGCRGMIEQIQIYCRDGAPGQFTIRYSPHPCLGPFGEVLITPLAGWSWVGAAVEEMWNYDSLFIWVSGCLAGADLGYDAVEPFDGHESADAGATWADVDNRLFIRAVYTGETPGDVPVSGIINNIPVPSTGAVKTTVAPINVLDSMLTTLVTREGAGTMLQARIWGRQYVVPNHWVVYYRMDIYADGIRAITVDNMDITQSPIAGTGRSSMGEFLNYMDGADAYYRMNLRIPIDFRRSLRIRVFQTTGAAMWTHGELTVNLKE